MTLQTFLFNLRESFKDEPNILCQYCGTVQKKAIGWDYQICDQCKTYLFDERNGI